MQYNILHISNNECFGDSLWKTKKGKQKMTKLSSSGIALNINKQS